MIRLGKIGFYDDDGKFLISALSMDFNVFFVRTKGLKKLLNFLRPLSASASLISVKCRILDWHSGEIRKLLVAAGLRVISVCMVHYVQGGVMYPDII